MSEEAVKAHIHRALLMLADLADGHGLEIADDLRALAEKCAPGVSGRA